MTRLCTVIDYRGGGKSFQIEEGATVADVAHMFGHHHLGHVYWTFWCSGKRIRPEEKAPGTFYMIHVAGLSNLPKTESGLQAL